MKLILHLVDRDKAPGARAGDGREMEQPGQEPVRRTDVAGNTSKRL